MLLYVVIILPSNVKDVMTINVAAFIFVQNTFHLIKTPVSISQSITICTINTICLGPHSPTNCKSTKTCRHCSDPKHNSSLCKVWFSKQQNPSLPNNSPLVVPTNSEPVENVTMSCTQTSTVFLETIRVYLKDKYGEVFIAHAMLDSGSQIQLVTKKTGFMIVSTNIQVYI